MLKCCQLIFTEIFIPYFAPGRESLPKDRWSFPRIGYLKQG